MGRKMKIDFLLNYPEKIKEVSEIVYKEFVVGKGSSMSLEEVIKHFSNTKEKVFPITLIALEDEVCLGTVSIFENDLKDKRYV